MRGTAGLSPFSMISQDVNQRHLVKQVRTPPVRPADGAGTPGGVFRPGETPALGRRER